MTPDFLTVEDVLFIHTEQIRLFGGDASVRDHGLLESAIAPAMLAGVFLLHLLVKFVLLAVAASNESVTRRRLQ